MDTPGSVAAADLVAVAADGDMLGSAASNLIAVAANGAATDVAAAAIYGSSSHGAKQNIATAGDGAGVPVGAVGAHGAGIGCVADSARASASVHVQQQAQKPCTRSSNAAAPCSSKASVHVDRTASCRLFAMKMDGKELDHLPDWVRDSVQLLPGLLTAAQAAEAIKDRQSNPAVGEIIFNHRSEVTKSGGGMYAKIRCAVPYATTHAPRTGVLMCDLWFRWILLQVCTPAHGVDAITYVHLPDHIRFLADYLPPSI